MNTTEPEFTFTEQERDEIQTFINSVGGDININENSLAHFSESTENVSDVADLEHIKSNEAVGESSVYQDYENEISDASSIDDVIEKAQKENEINQNWIAILDEDIQRTKSAVLAENDDEKKKKLEDTVAALLHLKDEKEYLIEQNNTIIDNVDITNNVLDDYSDYEEELSETNNFSDPIEKAQKENAINNEIIVSIDENIQDLKDQIVLEKDEEKKSQLESDMEELTDYRSRAVDKIEDNTLIIEEGYTASVNETDDVNSPPIKYEDYQDKIDEFSTISDPLKRAENENEINDLWLADLKEDAEDIKNKMDSEEDPAKELELLMGMNTIFREMSEVEAAIKKNDDIISTTDVVVEEANLETADSYKTLLNELDNEVVDENDFEKSYSTDITFKNNEAQEKANNIEGKIDEITIKEQEITSLEEGNFYYLSDKKKAKIQSKIEEKKKEIFILEEDVSEQLAIANNIEKDDNDTKINELRMGAENVLNSVQLDSKFVEASYFEEKANENFRKADELRILAENTADADEKSDLLKQVNSNDLAGRKNQEKSIAALEELTSEGYVADYLVANSSEVEDIVETEVEDIVETEVEDIVETEVEVIVETEVEDIVETEVEDIVETEVEDIVETEVEDIVETEVEDIVETEVEDIVETEVEDIVETEVEDIVETEVEDIVETEVEDIVETEVEDIVETEVEVIVETEVEDIVETEVEDIVETAQADVAKVMDLPQEEVAGLLFNPNETDIDIFEVSLVPDEKGIEGLKYTNSTSAEMIAKNQVEIDELAIINKEIKTQEVKLEGASEKDKKKINQQIEKLKEEKGDKGDALGSSG